MFLLFREFSYIAIQPINQLMEHIPHYVSVTFFACVIATFGFLFYAFDQASNKGNLTIIFTTLLSVWIFVISLFTFRGFFLEFEPRPPRLILAIAPLALAPFIMLAFRSSRQIINRMPITTLTYIHIIRVPVEIVLWWLFVHGAVAQSMTFEGLNYDILSGISAPFAGLFLVGMKSKSRLAAIIWNVATMALLFNIVIRAILATPYFYDPPVGDQANIAVFYFPYVLLPAFIVPAIFFCHVASLYKLIRFSSDEEEE